MFSKLLGKKDTKNSENDALQEEIKSRVAKMNLTEMRAYLNNNIKDFFVTSYGLNEVLRKLTSLDEKSQKYYLNADDMDSKKKKAFDLVIGSMKNSNMTLETLELLKKFIEVYADIIAEYDRKHKEIYISRLNDAVDLGVKTLEHLLHISNKTNILSE